MTAATRLGRYSVGERIGTGGVADVFVATADGAEGWGKQVVLKCLRPHVADVPEVVAGLIREAKLAQRLQHGNIVQVFDFAVHDGLPYVVMEHVDGCTLGELSRDLARRGERLPLEAALHVVERIAEALAYAHRLLDDAGLPLDIVHRDVKPSNVLLSTDGLVKLADFGIAKVAHRGSETLPGQRKGTPTYWAPEQAAGAPVDGRADVYGLGVVLRELVGERADKRAHDDTAQPSDPRVDDPLRALIAQATAARAEQRLRSMRALVDQLRDWAAAHRVRPSAEAIATLVLRAKHGRAAAVRVALDSALLSTIKGDTTRQHEHSVPAARARPAWRRPTIAGLAALATVAALATTVVLAADSCGAPSPAAALRSVRAADPLPPVPVRPQRSSAATPASGPATAAKPTTVSSIPQPHTPVDAPHARAAAALPSPTAAEPPRPEPSVAPRKPPKRRTGLLKVNTLPWAEVSVDGRALGRVPVVVRLTVGRHRVVLRNPSVGTKVQVIAIERDGELLLTRWPN